MSRKSLANKVLDAQQVLGENDDEAERLKLRNFKEDNATLNSTSSNKRHSLGLSCLIGVPESQMKDHISHCIKLNAENKISVKNAFTLEMIDFMSFIVSKQKAGIANLQIASVELDVCTKIYSYRVDGIYKDILKMAGGLDKQEKNLENAPNEEALCENEEMQLKSQVKKRKKNKQKICTTESALKVCVETSQPLQSIIGSGDLCSTDMLYQAILPIHANSGFYYHQYNDVILDIVDDVTVYEKNSSEYTIASVEDCTNLDICSFFSDFKFLNWSCKDEPEDIESNEESSENRFQFDLDASIPLVEEIESKSVNYFDIQEDEDNVNLCMRNPEQVENIVDLRNIVVTQVPELYEPSEYSFLQKHCIHWAGPSYWKIRTFGKVLSNSKVVETCHQVGLKKKKAIVLEYNDNIKSAVEQDFKLVQAARIQFRTTPKSWKETKKTLPEDVHYDDSQLNKLYIYPSIILNHSQNEDQSKMTQLATNEDYNYNTENDISNYCHEIDTNSEEMQEGNELEELRTEDNNTDERLIAFIGDNLIAPPKLTQKIVVPYALRAKKIDMRQLKQTIWKLLTTSNNKEKENAETPESGNADKVKESKPFNMVYKSLPSMLSKTNVEALSLPVAFVSLLHLANEKSLNLSSVSDLSDIIVNED